MKPVSNSNRCDGLEELPRINRSEISQEALLKILRVASRSETVDLHMHVLTLQAEVEELTEVLQTYQRNVWVSNKTFLHILRILAQRKLKEKPVQVVKQISLTPKQYERSFVRLSNFIAAIICRTYLEQGDEATLADDEALIMIRDLLLMFDETIIVRNTSKRRIAELLRLGYKRA